METDSEQTDSCLRGGALQSREKKGEGWSKTKLMDTDNSSVITRGEGGGGVEEGEGSQMVMEGELTWGGEHTIQCTDDVL